MGRYCKAYQLHRFRQFPGWTENAQNARKEKKEVDGKEIEFQRQLDDNSILYLQRNYIVTDGIFIDENIIFDRVTAEWTQFCREVLKFEIPKYILESEAKAEEHSKAETASSGNGEQPQPVADAGS